MNILHVVRLLREISSYCKKCVSGPVSSDAQKIASFIGYVADVLERKEARIKQLEDDVANLKKLNTMMIKAYNATHSPDAAECEFGSDEYPPIIDTTLHNMEKGV